MPAQSPAPRAGISSSLVGGKPSRSASGSGVTAGGWHGAAPFAGEFLVPDLPGGAQAQKLASACCLPAMAACKGRARAAGPSARGCDAGRSPRPSKPWGCCRVQGGLAEKGAVLWMCPPEDGTGGHRNSRTGACAGEVRAQGRASLLRAPAGRWSLQEKFVSVHHGQWEVFVRAD